MPFILETNIQSSGNYKEDRTNNSSVDMRLETTIYSVSNNITYLLSIEILYKIYKDKTIIGKQMTKVGAFVIVSNEEKPELIDEILLVKAPIMLYDYARKKIKSFWLIMDYPPFSLGDYDFNKSLDERKRLTPDIPVPISLE